MLEQMRILKATPFLEWLFCVEITEMPTTPEFRHVCFLAFLLR
jgi:hypothetical protein